jgi:hypothetical protein
MMKCIYDWPKIQAYYDLGYSVLETSEKFGVSQQAMTKSRYFSARSREDQHKLAVARRIKNRTLGHSQATKDKLSKIAIKRGFGGRNYRKTFKYKGVLLESSYELALAKELDKHKIDWVRPKRFYWTDMTGKQRFYTPDFYLPEYDIYLDPKNDYLIKKDSEKVSLCSAQNDVRIFILNKTQLTWKYIAGLV